MGLIHADLEIGWFFYWFCEVDNEVFVDLVTIGRFTGVDGAAFVGVVFVPAGVLVSG